jgi:PKD repeat protein
MSIKSGLLSILYFLCLPFANAQKGFSTNASVSCGAAGAMNHLFQQDNRYKQIDEQIEQQLLNFKKTNPGYNYTQAVVTLPVVVHIIHNNGTENISDARVMAGIQHLNEAYANTGYYNPADGVNTNIQFCMAQRDPNGNTTNGITRDVSSYTNMNGPEYYTDDQNVKNINRWNPGCYINIWIVNSIPGSVAGYAYLPSAHGSMVDGIIVEAAFFGNSYASDVVIIHEMGHYLGLYHTFEGGCTNTDCLADGDKVCDTPPDNSTSFTSCGVPVNSCNTDTQSGFSSDQNDLTQDYMDYGNWDCMTVFTQGQANRMNWFITNVRSSLLNCRSCLPPCPNPVTADFNSSATSITVGGTINFTNTSVNGVNYKWYINDVQQSTATNFSNTFNSAGVYEIKLVATGNNTTLCDSSAKKQVITVTCPVTAGFTASAIEIPVGQTISFTNTSTGTPVSYNWYIDNVPVSNSINFSSQFTQPGTFTIKLVVGSGTCTSEKTMTVEVTTPCDNNLYFEKMISLPTMNFAPKQTLVARDSGIVILGATVSPYPNPFTEAFTIMKLSKSGNLLWSKNYYTTVRLTPLRIMQTYDGNFIAVGLQAFGNLNYRFFIMKINGNGGLIWQKSYTKTGITNFYSGVDGTLQETASHDIILGITMEKTNNEGDKTYLLKLSSTGDIIWNKEVNSVFNIVNSALKNNSLYTSYVSLVTTPYNQVTADIAKIDITSGSLLFAKKYSFPPPVVPNVTQILRFENLVLFNDELRLTGTITAGGGIGDTGSHIIARIDTFGIIKEIKRIRFTDPLLYITNDLPVYYRHGIITDKGDYSFFEMGQSPYTPYTTKVIIHHTDIAATSPATEEVFKNVYPNFHYKPVDYSRNDNFKDRGNNVMVMACFVKEGQFSQYYYGQ